MTISRNLSFLAEGVSSTGVLGATYGGTGQSSITTGDLLYGSASNTISKLAIGSTGTILRVVAGVPSWGTDYTGTVTSVAALTLGTTGTDLSSTVANGTTTPVITLNVPTASATNRGVLSSTDWTTFNNKGSGSVTSVAATVPSFLSISGSPITTSGTLAITYSGTALPIANGGTGLTSFTANQIHYGSFSQSSNLTWNGSALYANGSLGIGVTPANWQFNGIIAQGAGYGIWSQGNGQYVGSNAYYNGGWKYQSTNYASYYYQANGSHQWFTAPSGTVDTGITWTQAMTLFQSGGVSIGNTTDPGATNLSVTGSLTLGTKLTVANGGTGLATLTAGYIPYGNGTGAFNSGSSLQYTSNGNGFSLAVANGGTWSEFSYQSSINLGNSGYGTYTARAGQVIFGSNFYVNSGAGYSYKNTDYASLISFTNGQIQFDVAASGTAGTGLSGFLQAVTIFPSGGMSVGNTTDKGAASLNVSGLIYPQQATTAGAPAYVKGAIYFDTTLNKLRVGGATAWETITSV